MDIRYGYEVWQDGEAQAWGEASTAEEALREADHCAMMYGKDGPVILRLNTRTEAYRADWEAQMNIEITDKGRAAHDALVRNAKRYLWLRSHGHDWQVFVPTDRNESGWGDWHGHTDMDASVDAAMGASHE